MLQLYEKVIINLGFIASFYYFGLVYHAPVDGSFAFLVFSPFLFLHRYLMI